MRFERGRPGSQRPRMEMRCRVVPERQSRPCRRERTVSSQRKDPVVGCDSTPGLNSTVPIAARMLAGVFREQASHWEVAFHGQCTLPFGLRSEKPDAC